MTFAELSKKIKMTAEGYADEICRIGDGIAKAPELGFCEEKTSMLVRNAFESMEIPYTYPHALTGVKAKLKGKSEKYNICIIGEEDCLRIAQHPDSDGCGRVHACGHNAQVAAMLGAAYALRYSGAMDELDGSVTFMAVPAEEFIELEYRNGLKDAGKIKYMSGKQQLIYEGAFDDVDMAMMIHAQPNEPGPKLYVRGHNLGCVAQKITFRGRTTHGSTPHLGVNALNAATLAIMGIHTNRETFREEENIRIHPIITKGGDVVNAVPDEVCIENYVRGASFEAINKGVDVVRRSCEGAAHIIGAEVGIDSYAPFFPLYESAELSEVMESAAADILGTENIVYNKPITGSTDMGNLSALIPSVQPSIGGFSGDLHSVEFSVTNKNTAYVKAAELLAVTAASLLYGDAGNARRVKEAFKPLMTKREYMEYCG